MKWLTVRLHLLGWLLLMAAAAGFGQTEKPAGPQGNQASDRGEQTYQISERTLRQNQNSAGFSLGVLGLYDSNYLGTASLQQGQAIVSLAPRLFANLSRRNSLLHFDYQLTYRHYPGGLQSNAADHVMGLAYDIQPWRTVNISLSDNARYGPNDILSVTAGINESSSQQVFFNPQKMLSNALSGAVVVTSGRKSRFEVAGDYNLMRFYSRPSENTDIERVRANHEYQLSRQWYQTTEVSDEWSRSANGVRNGSILRFLGGLTYRSRKGWTFTGQAGGDRTHMVSGGSLKPSYLASVAKQSVTTRMGIEFWRRSSIQVGLSGLNQSDNINARLEHRFLPRLSVRLQAQYYRTFGVENIGTLRSISGRAGLEYTIIPSILVSMSLDYLFQRQPAATTRPLLNQDRYMISIGLFYFYPATKR
jgi:hypothetical protein